MNDASQPRSPSNAGAALVGGAIDQARKTAIELGTNARAAVAAGQDAFAHDRSMRDARSVCGAPNADDSAVNADAVKHSSD